MAEYIKREAAVKAVEKYGPTNGVVWGRHTGLAICIASEIFDIPAADVAPVVRCKDCRYFKMYKCRMGYSRYDDFCSYGERKD